MRAQIKQKKFPNEEVFLEVSPEFFDYLSPDPKTKFLMYKDIMVVKKGEHDKIKNLLKGEARV